MKRGSVIINDVKVLENPAKFTSPFRFEITFECVSQIKEDLEWRLTYVGSAQDTDNDQILESLFIGPFSLGSYKFVFESNPPNMELIPRQDILGVTVLILSCLYKNKEFIRIGYYVHNEYSEGTEIPKDLDGNKIIRNILTEPRCTTIPIAWDDEIVPEQMMPPEVALAPEVVEGVELVDDDDENDEDYDEEEEEDMISEEMSEIDLEEEIELGEESADEMERKSDEEENTHKNEI